LTAYFSLNIRHRDRQRYLSVLRSKLIQALFQQKEYFSFCPHPNDIAQASGNQLL